MKHILTMNLKSGTGVQIKLEPDELKALVVLLQSYLLTKRKTFGHRVELANDDIFTIEQKGK